ncbi:DUF2510 domain-containing protein [Actinophytocola glycyrrhizae]|uniref:DUF2510 domain-containing protein n=1 Tax=Actinophytocola glycyrrhizae TaxID=2044873 RepID=A0ABV9SDE0_9PSEU
MGLRWRRKRVDELAAQHEKMVAHQREVLERHAGARQVVRSPGWYPDEEQPGQVRWWNGTKWTDNVRPN